jgi:hypothetical protein
LIAKERGQIASDLACLLNYGLTDHSLGAMSGQFRQLNRANVRGPHTTVAIAAANLTITRVRILPHSHPRRSMIGPMAVPVALFATKRKRGNPNWGRPVPPLLALPTEFEMRVRQLQLTAGMYASSRELRAWCERNRNRCYVPEWLLGEWGMTVDLNFGAVA